MPGDAAAGSRVRLPWLCTQELACSLNASSPGLPLLVLTVAGDLGAAAEARAAQLGTLVRVEDVRFPNAMRDGR